MSKHCPERFKSSLCHKAGEKKKKRKPPNHQCWDHLEWSNPCFKSLCSPVPLQCWRVWAECYLLDCLSVCWLLSLVSKIFLWRLFWEAAFFKLTICSQFGRELLHHKAFYMARTKNPSPCCREGSVTLKWGSLYFGGWKPQFSRTLKPIFGGGGSKKVRG